MERLRTQHYMARRQAKYESIGWLLWYDPTRVHSTLAYVSPMRFDQHWLSAEAMQVNL